MSEKSSTPRRNRPHPQDTGGRPMPARTTRQPSTTPSKLKEAFQHLFENTVQLKRAYRQLTRRLQKHNRQLQWQNRQLEERLGREIAAGTLLRHTLDSLTLGILVVDREGMIVIGNREAERLVQRPLAEAQGVPIEALLCTTMPQTAGVEWLGHQPCRFEHVISRDHETLHVRFTLAPWYSPHGEQAGSLVMIEDVTEEKHRADQTQRTNRLDAMAEMATNISQQVRNTLGSMELFASLLKQEVAQHDEPERLVEHLLSGIKNLNQTVSNLLLFTKHPRLRLAPADPHQLLEDSLTFASQLVRHQHLRVEKYFEAQGIMLQADAALLKQVFLNLTLNAIQAMPEGGTLTLGTRLEQGSLQLHIHDTGTGIAPEVTEKIFNPFFSTKAGATGLGLTMVHNIVKAHSGTIHVHSTQGQGTTFILGLPLEPTTSAAPPREVQDHELGGQEPQHDSCGIDSTAK
jgi:signal transduction histidine kinase